MALCAIKMPIVSPQIPFYFTVQVYQYSNKYRRIYFRSSINIRLHNVYSQVKFLIRPISSQSREDQKFLTWEGDIMIFKYTCIFKTTPSFRVMADDSMTRSVRRRERSSKLTGVSQLYMCLKVAHYMYTTVQIENTSIYLYLGLLLYTILNYI